MYRVASTTEYREQLKQWSKSQQDRAEKLSQRLKQQPSGKPLRYNFLREARVGERRVYYLIYEDLEIILLVATSDKKEQQATIDAIRNKLDEFQQFVRKL